MSVSVVLSNLPTEFIGYAAAICVVLTFCATHMLLLRGLAIFSNLLFIWYGQRAELAPILVLHALLLPINIGHAVRLVIQAYGRGDSSHASRP